MNQKIEKKRSFQQNFKHKLDFFVNTKLSIWGSKIASQRHISALRDAFVGYSAFVIVGSFFLIIGNFPVNGWEEFQTEHEWLGNVLVMPKRITFDLMSLWIAALFSYNLSKTYKLNPIFPMIGSVAFFVLLIPLAQNDAGFETWDLVNYLPFGGYAGTDGILLALISGTIITEWFNFCKKKNVRIPLPDAVPPAVSAAFSAMIPIAALIVVGIGLRAGFGATQWHYLPVMIGNLLAAPISEGFVGQLGGVLLVTFLGMFGWCFGINSSAVNGVVRPFWMTMLEGNQKAYEAFQKTGEYIWANQPFVWEGKQYIAQIGTEDFYNFVDYGGAGTTVGIILFLAIFAKSEKLRTIARISLIPGIFSINEPFMFGVPIVLNPFMWIPLIVAPMTEGLIAYLAMDLHIVPIPIGAMNPWTLPFGLLGYFTILHWSGVVLQLLNITVAALIWYPFMKYQDQVEFKTENNLESVKTTQVFKVAKRLGLLPPIIGALKNDQYFKNLRYHKPYNNDYAALLEEREATIKTAKNQFILQIVEIDKAINPGNKKASEVEIKNLKEQMKLKVSEIKQNYAPQLKQLKTDSKKKHKEWNQHLTLIQKANAGKLKDLKRQWKAELVLEHVAMKENIKDQKANENLIEIEKLKTNYKKQKLEMKKKLMDAKYIFEMEMYNEKIKLSQLKTNYYKTKYST